MKKDDVRTGATYLAKVSGEVVPVRITEEKWKGENHTGWVGTNTQTGRSVYIKSAQRLRAQVGAAKAAPLAPVAGDAPHVGPGAPDGEVVGESAKAASPAPPKAASDRKGKKAGKATGGQKGKGAKVPAKSAKPKKDRPMSGLDAAAKVLADAGEPMRVKDIVAAAEKKGLWKSKAGKTPEATVYAAIIREIFNKGVDSRFVKKDRGLFAAAGK
jgi:hypothetical protein